MFGDYLVGATEIQIIDPYIRLPYQLRNLMEFAKLVSEKRNEGGHDNDIEEVKLHLITNNNEEYIENAKESFETMAYSLESIGILFSYEFLEPLHDRSIVLNNGWKIVLGRGLDLWQKTGGWFHINEYIQEQRFCKGCEVTFLRGEE